MRSKLKAKLPPIIHCVTAGALCRRTTRACRAATDASRRHENTRPAISPRPQSCKAAQSEPQSGRTAGTHRLSALLPSCQLSQQLSISTHQSHTQPSPSSTVASQQLFTSAPTALTNCHSNSHVDNSEFDFQCTPSHPTSHH